MYCRLGIQNLSGSGHVTLSARWILAKQVPASRTQRLNTDNTKTRHWTRSWTSSIHLPFSHSISLRSNWLSGSRIRRFSTASTKTRHWTRSWTSSIHIPSSRLVSLRSVLVLSSDLLLSLSRGVLARILYASYLQSQPIAVSKISLPWQF
jgi:hypothetical protein